MPLIFRSFNRARGLYVAVTAMLALGMGGLITTFTLVDAALWRLPFDGADRIAVLYTTRIAPPRPLQRERWSFPRIQMLRSLASDLATIANYTAVSVTLNGGDYPEWMAGEVVSPQYFSIVGARPLLGRAFLAADDDTREGRESPQPVIILSHDLWQRRFAGDPAVLGTTVRVNGLPLTVVGVMPDGFRGLTDKAQLWVPTVVAPTFNYPEYLTTDQNFISVVARLSPGVDMARAESAMRVLGTRVHAALPDEDADSAEVVSGTAVPLNEARVAPLTRRSLLMLLAAVALLYLLACANAINLLLGRAASRRREAAIHAALGGTPARLLLIFHPEAIVVVGGGGNWAAAQTAAVSRVLTVPGEVWGPRNFYGSLAAFAEPSLGARSTAFAAALTALTMVLVAWAPALSMARLDILGALREGSRGAAARAGSLRRPTVRGVVVALEAALAMLLLIGGGLMVDSFMRMRRTDLGINADRVLTFWVRPPEVRVPVSAAPAFIDRLLQSISSVPGVVAVTVDGGAPASGSARSTLFIAGRPAPRANEAPPVLRHYIAPDHFRVLGVPLLRGRTFTTADVAGRPRVAIISQSAARRFWRTEDPIGQRVWFGGGSSFSQPDSSAEIVGIVGDVVHEPLDVGPNRNDFYTPYPQFTYSSRMVMVRTIGEPMTALPDIRRAVQQVDAELPLVEVQTMNALIGGSWSRQRFDAVLFGTFAFVGLLLATSGIYAVVSYAVSQRTREMGIRMALGARPASIIGLVIREGMAFPALGLLAGLASSLALSRFLQKALYEVKPTDPLVFGACIVVLVAVSVAACFTPARRATRQDPLVALRSD